MIELLEQAIKELDFEKNVKNPQHIFEILNDILSTNLELCGYLMKMNAHSHIVRKIDGLLKSKLKEFPPDPLFLSLSVLFMILLLLFAAHICTVKGREG